ncbi:hypothetical protein Syun_016103 [Stephania yunnanensis]|uniref:Uncharacterized protein n=1 Tax=Stephania yunnanensis TaxID=152371 RepID=A0AAP0J6X7_9MAGN
MAHHHTKTESVSSSEDASTANKSTQSTVTLVYHAMIVGMYRCVTVIWCKTLINHTLNITVDCNLHEDQHYICKIDFKPWHFWTKKGLKSFDVQGKKVDVYWDLRAAKFSNSGSPEPSLDYYIAMVYDEEVVLLLGDIKKKAYKRTRSRPSLADAILVHKKEHVFAKKCFTTRGKFDQRKDHDIVVEISLQGPRDPEVWISIDGIVVVHVTNLQWKFRGNETVLVNKIPVQVFWDVHDWLFSGATTSQALFIFKPGGAPTLYYGPESDRDGSTCSGETDESSVLSDQSSNQQSGPEFTLFLYAWKIE